MFRILIYTQTKSITLFQPKWDTLISPRKITVLSTGATHLSINPLADLKTFIMNVGGALITVGDETIASGSRLEVAKSLPNSIVNEFSFMFFK